MQPAHTSAKARTSLKLFFAMIASSFLRLETLPTAAALRFGTLTQMEPHLATRMRLRLLCRPDQGSRYRLPDAIMLF
jgi:hypothetical protein